MEPKIVVIVGMTASGKSAVAMKLAQERNGEIICADSRTIYKGMDIGTAKPSPTDRKAVRHHLLDIITPDQKFTVADFQKQANAAIKDIASRGKLPIVVGGTGLYVDALIYNYSFGGPKAGQRQALRPNTLVLGTRLPDDTIKLRITERIEQMFARGLEAEVKQLAGQYGWQSFGLTAIGYREFQPFFKGDDKITTEEVKEQIKKATWQYARRQRTWFKRSTDIHWQ